MTNKPPYVLSSTLLQDRKICTQYSVSSSHSQSEGKSSPEAQDFSDCRIQYLPNPVYVMLISMQCHVAR